MWRKRVMVKALFVFIVCASAFVAAAPSIASDFRIIGTEELHSMVVDNTYRLEAGRQREFKIIDARTKDEYNRAHIASAISIPEKDFEKSAGLLPRDRGSHLVVYCDGAGSATCEKWAHKARSAGYTTILVYTRGFTAWKEMSMPIAPL